jgi:hypothetical protein
MPNIPGTNWFLSVIINNHKREKAKRISLDKN